MTIATDVANVAEIVDKLASAFDASFLIAGFSIHEIAALARGVANADEAARELVEQLRNWNGEVTEAQRAEWRAKAAALHASIQAA